jgi:hypothetical protein
MPSPLVRAARAASGGGELGDGDAAFDGLIHMLRHGVVVAGQRDAAAAAQGEQPAAMALGIAISPVHVQNRAPKG